jgi:esterase/lipase
MLSYLPSLFKIRSFVTVSLLALSLVVGFVFVACVPSSDAVLVSLSERHRPSEARGMQIEAFSSFDAYEAAMRERVAGARTDLNEADEESIVDGNAPFRLKPSDDCPAGQEKRYRRGVLLTHGLTGSPYAMRALGSFFQKNCFWVMAILLPGHGTRPGDLLETTWQDWVAAETLGVDTLASEVDEVYLSGFSLGGTLSIRASLHDGRVKGLFLFAPAMKISSMAAFADWHKAISWAAPRYEWMDIAPDEDPFKYESFPLNAATQVYLLIDDLQSLLADQAVTIPVFVVASEDDTTVSAPHTLEFFKKTENRSNRILFYSAREIPSDEVTDRMEIVRSDFSAQRILSAAHTGLLLPASDPHYGKDGDYKNCSHYFDETTEKYPLCKAGKEDFIGEVTAENLEKGVVRRLMYNPNYDGMTEALERFIHSLA